MNFYTREIKLTESVSELHCTLVFNDVASARSQISELVESLKMVGAKLVEVELFGKSQYSEIAESLKSKMDTCECPVTHVLPLDEVSAPELAGMRVVSLIGANPIFKQTQKGSKTVSYQAGSDSYCRALGVTIDRNTPDLSLYTSENIEELEAALALCDMSFSDIVRTWFYNCKILDWYDDFNKGRTASFKQRKVFDGLLPASTGIGAPNPKGVPIQSAFIALKGGAKSGKVYEIESPLQCGAPKYGSSFSRAVEFDLGNGGKRIMVSGSASIDFVGNTVYFGDIKKQVALTMDVIGEILKSRGLSFKDTVSSVAYCMNPQYISAFVEWQKENGQIPYVPSYSTVCRGDLMFEVELEAARNS